MRYKLCFMYSLVRGIERWKTLEAISDEAAVRLASEHAGCQRLELWQGRRLVHCFEPKSVAPVQPLGAAE